MSAPRRPSLIPKPLIPTRSPRRAEPFPRVYPNTPTSRAPPYPNSGLIPPSVPHRLSSRASGPSVSAKPPPRPPRLLSRTSGPSVSAEPPPRPPRIPPRTSVAPPPSRQIVTKRRQPVPSPLSKPQASPSPKSPFVGQPVAQQRKPIAQQPQYRPKFQPKIQPPKIQPVPQQPKPPADPLIGVNILFKGENNEQQFLRIEEYIASGGFGAVYKGVVDNRTDFYYAALKVLTFPVEPDKREQNDIVEVILHETKIAELKLKGSVTIRFTWVSAAFMEELEKNVNNVTFEKFKKKVFTNTSSRNVPDQIKVIQVYDYIDGIPLYKELDAHILKIKGTPDKGTPRIVHAQFETKIILKYFSDLIEGLMEFNTQGFVHRDIKPENIMIDKTRLKYIDFGLICPMANCPVTTTGSPFYVAPELYANSNTVDWKKVDVFSLGSVLFEMIFASTPLEMLVNPNCHAYQPDPLINSYINIFVTDLNVALPPGNAIPMFREFDYSDASISPPLHWWFGKSGLYSYGNNGKDKTKRKIDNDNPPVHLSHSFWADCLSYNPIYPEPYVVDYRFGRHIELFKYLLLGMLHVDPAERFTIQEAHGAIIEINRVYKLRNIRI